MADEVIRDGIAAQTIGLQLFPKFGHVAVFGQCSANFKMVAPAGKFDTVVAHLFNKR